MSDHKSEDLPDAVQGTLRHPVDILAAGSECGSSPLLARLTEQEKERFFMSKTKKTLIALLILAVLAAALLLVWSLFGPQNGANDADKAIVVTVVHGDGGVNEYAIVTNQEFLRGALEDAELVEGSESEYGLFITAVDGEAADSSLEQWWCINDGEGEMLMTGVDTTVINDGDAFSIVLMTGYDEY